MHIDANSRPKIYTDLGKVISVHPTAAVYVQRAAVVAIVSFVFFLMMLVGFAVRQHVGYFLLASAFLAVYLFTMFGWWTQRNGVLTICEDGLSFRKFRSRWDEITSFVESADANGSVTMKLTDKKGRSVSIPPTLDRVEQIRSVVRARVPVGL
jgi:hypothetical protein